MYYFYQQFHYISVENNRFTFYSFDNPTQIIEILEYSKVTYEDYEFQVKSLEQMLSKRQSHKIDILSKMYFMYEKYFKYLSKDKVPILPLSTHKLAKHFTNIVVSANFLRHMISLGALAYKDKSYHFGTGKNRCRTYYINTQVFKEAAKYCKECGILPYRKVETMVDPIKNKKILEKVKLGKCRISLKEANERQISQALVEKYPFLKELKEEITKNNQKYESPFFWDTCDFGFRYNDKHTHVTGIGFRVSNSLCNRTREERTEILKSLNIHKEDDVSASIYSFNKSLSQGFWREPCDMYEEIHNNVTMDNKPPFDLTIREMTKTLSMRPYFGDSEADVFSKLDYGCKWCIGDQSDKVKAEIHLLSEAIDKTVGPSWKSAIFAVESYVMFKIKQRLMNEGLEVYQVYDCLYHNGNIDLESLLKEEFNTFYKKYDKWIESYKSKLKFRKFNIDLKKSKDTKNPTKMVYHKNSTKMVYHKMKGLKSTTIVDSSNIFGNPLKPKASMNFQKNDIESSLRSDSNHSNGNILNFKFNNFKFNNLKIISLFSNSYIISPLYKRSSDVSKVRENSIEYTKNSTKVEGFKTKNIEEIPKNPTKVDTKNSTKMVYHKMKGNLDASLW